ncbi:DNA helicase UvrA [Neisseria mucosa]|uniref:DNA helicase UvrA n=1 Tax=Neisseria mucosa TaxID=488 RepID=A0ABN4YDA9_NEIMU|nr:DNA helicase UvrA [Neisseria mucosa]
MSFSKLKTIYQNNYIKASIPLFSLQKNCIIYQLRRYHDTCRYGRHADDEYRCC